LYHTVVYPRNPKVTRALHGSLPRRPEATATAGVQAGTGVPATYRLRTGRNTTYNISKYLDGIRVVRWSLSIEFCTGKRIDKKQDFMFHRSAQLVRGMSRLLLVLNLVAYGHDVSTAGCTTANKTENKIDRNGHIILQNDNKLWKPSKRFERASAIIIGHSLQLQLTAQVGGRIPSSAWQSGDSSGNNWLWTLRNMPNAPRTIG
jgi:hypothetical protein